MTQTYHQKTGLPYAMPARTRHSAPTARTQGEPARCAVGILRHGQAHDRHLYAVPVLAAFDDIRNCSHCRRNTSEDNCKAWREARGAVAVLTKEARRFAKGVDELREATGGCAATIYQFACGSVAYFAPDAPDFQEAGELKGDDLAKAVRILNGSGVQASGWRERVEEAPESQG